MENIIPPSIVKLNSYREFIIITLSNSLRYADVVFFSRVWARMGELVKPLQKKERNQKGGEATAKKLYENECEWTLYSQVPYAVRTYSTHLCTKTQYIILSIDSPSGHIERTEKRATERKQLHHRREHGTWTRFRLDYNRCCAAFYKWDWAYLKIDYRQWCNSHERLHSHRFHPIRIQFTIYPQFRICVYFVSFLAFFASARILVLCSRFACRLRMVYYFTRGQTNGMNASLSLAIAIQ